MYMNEAQKTRKRMQAIAEATTDYNTAKVGYRNEMTVTKANDLVEKANYLLRLQKTYGKHIQPNEQIQLVMDYALEDLKKGLSKDDTSPITNKGWVRKNGKLEYVGVTKVKK